jgi:DNA end-binding protein Ku
MAVRAMWKGVIGIGDEQVPVKLYSAAQDRAVHFRLLHDEDLVPVRQRLVEPETDAVYDYAETERAYVTPERDLVMLTREELEALEPKPSRDIEILRFVPLGAIDYRWYDRPYFLGPDGRTEEYLALAEALREADREGVARWVMRKKEYRGALRAGDDGCLMLITLRPAEETIAAEELAGPVGKALEEREIAMAQQLLSILEADFDPSQYRDEYRQRVIELIEAKAKGKTVRRQLPTKTRAPQDLTRALRASIAAERKRA